MISVIINGYGGPTISEMESLIPDTPTDSPIPLKWLNSKNDLLTILKYPEHSFVLHTPDLNTAERTSTSLNVPFTPPLDVVKRGMRALVNDGIWRQFHQQYGAVISRVALLKGIAGNIRAGNNPFLVRKVVAQCVLTNVAVIDMDVLLCLRSLKP